MGASGDVPAAGNGFSFIETMVAMALLAVIVGDVALVTMHASRSSAGAQRLAVAVTLAENAIERSRNTDFNGLDLPANPNSDCFNLWAEPAACGGGGAVFTRTRTVTPLAGTLASALSADVDVVVAWVDARGAGQQYRLMSVVSRY